MSFFNTGRSKSTKTTNVNQTTTNIHDDRIGAADGSLVADDGATVHIERIEADMMQDALSEYFGFADRHSGRNFDVMKETIGLIDTTNRETGGLVKEVLAKSRSESSEGLKDLNKTFMWVGIAVALAYGIRGLR